MQANGYKAWTIRGALNVTGRVFDFAARRLDWAGHNPVRLLDRSERPTADAKSRRILTADELAALIEAPMVTTPCSSGWRPTPAPG